MSVSNKLPIGYESRNVPYVLSTCRGILPSYDRYRVRGRISALMTGALRNVSALEFFESRRTRRKTQSRHSDGEGAVNLST